MAALPVEVVNAAGEITSANEPWFDAAPDTNAVIIAVLGPQASGKSTLANELFGTAFPVAARTSVGSATTRGILAARPVERPDVVVLDVEGADARERGRNGRNFQARCASFVANLADCMIINMWYHDTCRVDSTGFELLRNMLLTCAQAIADGSSVRSALVFAIRDVEDDVDPESLQGVVSEDVEDIWTDVATQAGLPPGGMTLDDAFDVTFVVLPHIRHSSQKFKAQVDNLRASIYDASLVKPAHSKFIPSDGLSPYATSVWDSVAISVASVAGEGTVQSTRDIDGFYDNDDFSIVAGYNCDAVFSKCLARAKEQTKELQKQVVDGNKITNLGSKARDIVVGRLEDYDAQTADYVEEPVYEKKRRELESIMDTDLMTVYMKNTAICAREALATFKRNMTSDMPPDYALFSADSHFVSAAKEGIRPGSTWSYATEQADLQNMMKEIAEQQRKLYDTQLTASMQHSKAIQFLRMQHVQMQSVQQQALGGAVGQWNVGAAYRPPDSNVNVSLGYQQGRTNLQLSMVPDESTSLLGPTGFTAGVGPGNLGLSFNVNF